GAASVGGGGVGGPRRPTPRRRLGRPRRTEPPCPPGPPHRTGPPGPRPAQSAPPWVGRRAPPATRGERTAETRTRMRRGRGQGVTFELRLPSRALRRPARGRQGRRLPVRLLRSRA